jgi:branched-chain amino acid transport system ATP-binding protein
VGDEPPPGRSDDAEATLMAILEVSDVSSGYAGEDVIHGLSFHVDVGEAVTIIGSNGAGKSTLFRAIVSMLKVSTGTIVFDGVDTTNTATHKIARMGLAYVPAERHLFPQMSVSDNLALGAFPHHPDHETEALVFEVFPRLAERRKQDAGTMSGGEQQMLAVARALMSSPKVLMLDEPTTGLAPRLAREAYEALAKLRDAGLTLVVAEQQVPLALKLASRGYVLENGHFELEGTSEALAGNPDVQRAYLGVA